MIPDVVVVDFETLPISDRPRYPPLPVGVAILDGGRSEYLSWGHSNEDDENTTTYGEAARRLQDLWASGRPLLFHNAKFDVDVAETHMGCPPLPWDRYHDTMPLLYLEDPRAPDFKLKPSSERLLELPSDERDAVVDWIVANQPVARHRITKVSAGAHISLAPARIVGEYAKGDVVRTYKLFKLLYPRIKKNKMLEAYDRERQLMPILLEMERRGVPVDLPQLRFDVVFYQKIVDKIDRWIRKKLRAPKLNIDAKMDLVNALIAYDPTIESRLGRTEKGRISASKSSLDDAITDVQLKQVFRYRAYVVTCLRTFMTPWRDTAELSGGVIYTTWHSTRGERGTGLVGTRTGRLSSTPNFQNIPSEFPPLFRHEKPDAILPKAPFPLPPPPLVRGYIRPFPGEVLLDRDYSQQELRILGHVEGGALMEAYKEQPWLDVHDHAQKMINTMLGTNYERKPIKNTGFGLIYGMGLGLLAEKSSITVEQAKQVRDAYLSIFPGLKQMYRELKYVASEDKPVKTWGGRRYFCEPPKLVDGQIRQFDYKMLNIIIQGSAADCTKEALIRFHRLNLERRLDAKVLLTVHDEMLVSAPREKMLAAMNALKEAMESVEFDVPMLSEGSWSERSWGDLKDYDVKGALVVNARSIS